MSEKKGFHPLVWVGIGCGVLVVLVGVGVVAAGFFVKSKAEQLVDSIENRPVETAARAYAALNPEVEFVSADEDARTVTLRNSSTGELTTIDYTELQEGRVTFDGEGGSTTFDANEQDGVTVSSPDGTFRLGGGGDLPVWVPRPDGVETQATYSTTREGTTSGTFLLTGRPPADILSYYRETLPGLGYSLESSSDVNGLAEQLVFADSASGRRLTLISTAGQDAVAVSYEGSTE